MVELVEVLSDMEQIIIITIIAGLAVGVDYILHKSGGGY